MTTKIKNVLVFSFTILAAAAVYIWFYPLNKGALSITADLSSYLVFTEEETVQCSQNPCITTLNTGLHNIKVQKDKYYPENLSVEISRGKTKEITIKFKKIPTLNISTKIPKDLSEKETLPESIKNSVLVPEWDKTGKLLAYIDQNDERLKVWNEKTGSKTITSLKSIGSGFKLYWSPDNKYIFGNDGKDAYFIDVEDASRHKKILDFMPQNAIWSSTSDYLLVNDDSDGLYKLDFSGMATEYLDADIDLKDSIWINDKNLIYFSVNSSENGTTIANFNPSDKTTTQIATKYDFPVEKINSDENNVIYLYNSKEKTWYELDY